MLVRVEKLSKSFGIHEVLKEISFFIDNNDKVGLVGANGMGKSTLVKCLLGEMEHDGGVINISPGLTIGYLEQAGKVPEGTLWEVLLGSEARVLLLRRKLEELSCLTAATQAQEQQEYIAAYQKAVEEYERLGGYEYDSLVRKVAFGLGFDSADFTKQVSIFSGGQKTRINLAMALIKKPQLLILDEPTNHLDIQMIEWLEEYLTAYSGGLLIISHDRYFLDKVTNKIMHLQNTGLQTFKGNFSAYLKQYTLQLESQTAAYEKQQEHIAATEEYIRRYKAGIKSKQARGRLSQLSRLERIDKPESLDSIKLRLPAAGMSADKTLVMDKVTIGYDKPLIRDVNLLVRRTERVAIIGANGTGKTSMLKSILGERKILTGRIELGNRVQIGYFSQEHEGLNMSATLLDEVMQTYFCTTEQARTMLGSILFTGDDVFKKIGTLSGGERARLALLKLMLQGANFLILDEPTNHLDVPAREVLEETLREFDGTMLVVSHDRYFLDQIVDRIWEIEAGQITQYLGNYSDYKAKKEDQLRILREANEEAQEQAKLQPKTAQRIAGSSVSEQAWSKPEAGPKKAERRSRVTEKDLEKTELKIREYEALRKVLEQKMALPENHLDAGMSERMAAEHRELTGVIDGLMQDWENIMEQLCEE